MPRRKATPTPIRPDVSQVPPQLKPRAPSLVVTPTEGAKILRIGYRQFYALIMSHEIDSFTIGRSRRIPVSAIEAFIARRLADAHNAAC